MLDRSRMPLSRGIRMGLLVAAVVGLATAGMAWIQAGIERRIDVEDQDRRAHVLLHQLSDPVRSALGEPDKDVARSLGVQLEGYRRLVGYAVFRPDGRMIASGKAVPEFADEIKPVVDLVLGGRPEATQTARSGDSLIHVFATRIESPDGKLLGALAVIHDVSNLDDRTDTRLMRFAFWILIVSCLLMILVFGVMWLVYERPLRNLADWMQRLRTGSASENPPVGLPIARLAQESERLAATFRAARSAASADSRNAVHDHNVWTRERLRDHALDCLQGGELIVASNREPYMHQLSDGRLQLIVPAGGLVTALDPVLQTCGGLWVAHGAGDADRQTADEKGRLTVPPGDSRYTLRRIWLSREEEQGYYYGFSNEGLWPMCHLAHERPTFRATDWESYVSVNRRFADAILDEIGAGEATVLVQDYHLALVPQFLKAAKPQLRVGIFWHIPWPNPEAFRICPWRGAILQGLLGADLLGFHLQQYCNNFLDTVDRMVEARLDWDHFAVELRGHHTLVRPFPISVESWEERGVPTGAALAEQMAQLRAEHNLGTGAIFVGVDRIDYTKGLPERLRAFGRFLEKYPQYRGQVTLVQLGAPSRTHLRRYRDLVAEIESMADAINWQYQTESWKPVRLLVAHHNAATVHAFMQMADACLVTSLHDGMNLVAKEYAAAKADGNGVLILSEFAGAARELADAVVINPYDIEQSADAIRTALEMGIDERRCRMERMRRTISEHNIYRWAAKILTELAATRSLESAIVVNESTNHAPSRAATPVAD